MATLKEYIGGRYQYREMRRPKLIAVQNRNRASIDALPPTMLHPIVCAYAYNAREAMKLIKAQLDA